LAYGAKPADHDHRSAADPKDGFAYRLYELV
jgi:hypothetical protein